jgi:hypothetical protein
MEWSDAGICSHESGLAMTPAARHCDATASAFDKAAILNSATDLGTPGTDPNSGRGLIDVAKALGL